MASMPIELLFKRPQERRVDRVIMTVCNALCMTPAQFRERWQPFDTYRSPHHRRQSLDERIVGCAPAVDEGLKTDALPGVAAIVIVADTQRRLVSYPPNLESAAAPATAFATSSWPRSGCEMVSGPTALVRHSSPTICLEGDHCAGRTYFAGITPSRRLRACAW